MSSLIAIYRKKYLIFVLFMVLLAIPQICFSQISPHWRYWRVGDGLAESYSRTVSINSNNLVLVNHGIVNHMSCLNGYHVRKLDNPGPYVPVFQNSYDQIWSVYDGGFQVYKNNKWIRYDVDGIDSDTLFFPISLDFILYLQSKSLMGFNVVSKQKLALVESENTSLGNFMGLTPSKDGGVWISGEKGLLKVKKPKTPFLPKLEWLEYVPPERNICNLSNPLEGENEHIYFVADTLNDDSLNRLISFDGNKWQMLYESEENIIRGWKGPQKQIWVQLNYGLSRISTGGIVHRINEEKIITGEILDVVCEPDGSFWLAMSSGLAHYSASLFRTPAKISHIANNVHAIIEQTNGDLWFISRNALVRNHDNQWKTFPFPEGTYSHPHESDAFCFLEDDRLILNCTKSRNLLTFDPSKKEYQFIQHPEGRRLRLIASRDEETAWVRTKGDDAYDYRLETYDGNSFKTVLDFSKEKEIIHIRHVREKENGEIWIGCLSELYVYSNEQLESMHITQGAWGTGIFWIHELTENILWAGSRNAIHQYDGNSWKTVISDLDRINSMHTSSNGSIWVASNSGIHRYSNGSWTSYTRENGLPSSIVHRVYQDSNGRIWLGTARGICTYHPETDSEPPQTFILNDGNSNEIASGGNLYLKFSGIDKWKRTPTEKLQYSSRLDNERWSPFKVNRTATFSKLKSGKHLFEVRAMDMNHNIDPTGAAYEFTVLSPWHHSLEFIIIGLALILFIAMICIIIVSNNIKLDKLVKDRTSNLTQINKELEHEINERKLAEKALQKSEKLYREAIEVANAVPYYRNYETNQYDFMGDGIESITGYAKHEITPDIWEKITLDFIPIGELAGLSRQEAIDKSRSSAEVRWRADYLIKTLNGETRWLSNAAIEVRNTEGTIVGSLGMLQNITNRKQVEKALQDSESKNRALLNAIPDLMVRIRSDGQYLDYKAPREFKSGYLSDKIVGANIFDVLPLQVAHQWMYFLRKALQTGESQTFEHCIEHYGNKCDCETRIVLSSEDEILAIIRDITERKILEKQILQIRETERKRIGDELHDDLCQCLTGIALRSKVLEERLSNISSPDRESAKQITNWINNAISKTRAIARGLHPIALEIQGLKPALEEMIVNAGKMHQIHCHLNYGNDISLANESYAIHLYRIVQESINNAIRHGQASNVWIEVIQNGNDISLTVKDDGVGIPDDMENTNGMGIQIMEYRSHIINAKFDIHRNDDCGTLVTCCFQNSEFPTGIQ